MKKTLKQMLKYNLKTLVIFELIYKLVSLIIFGPLFLTIFQIITKLSGFTYLTFENFFSFLLNPLTIIFLIILLIFITFYSLIDIGTLIIIFDASYQSKKISVKNAFICALEKSLKVFKLKNILLVFLIIFLVPFLNIGISSSFISTISIPEFILDYISNNLVLSILYGLLLIGLAILLFRWLYVVNYFILEDCNFKEARSKSINLSKKNKLKDYLSIIFTQLIIFVCYLLFIALSIILIIGIYKILDKINIFGYLSITIIWLMIALSFIVMFSLSTPISYAIISALFYEHKKKRNEKIHNLDIKSEQPKKINKRFNIFKWVVIVLTLVSATIFTYGVIHGKFDLKVEHIRSMAVTAHRGASVSFPENTMSAFVAAKEKGADWIELDVQQTKDEKIIVLHDTNLKRTTGVDKNTWELTYAEVKELDAGSFFDSKFKNERIPLLEEVLEFAKNNNMKLNIELKPTGYEKDFEKEVVSLIKKYDFIDNCVVTSQVYSVLQNVKKYDKNVKTVYVMSLAYGNILELTDADSFSIEASSITKTLVNKLHNNNKEVYAWTVNTKDSISKMINLNVDNIITDNITLAKDTIYSSKTSNLVNEYIKIIDNIF